ncbi:MAG: hypothetical protein IJ496_09510 [Ruminococcus sp.]|nr:hypothetical protein [Ruminococcus sp.]
MNLDRLTMEQLQGNQKELAETIGIEAYRKLVARYGGGNVYVCKLDTLLQPFRDEEIYRMFNGRNYREIAVQYNLTEKTVREIIAKQNEANMSGQMLLIDDEF